MGYIKTKKLSITHEDQEVDGLRFSVLAAKDNIDYVQVEGTEEAILKWKEKVEGEDSTIEEIDSIIASYPKTKEEIEKGNLVKMVADLSMESKKKELLIQQLGQTVANLDIKIKQLEGGK